MALITLYETEAAIDEVPNLEAIRLCTGRGYNHPSGPGYFEPVITAASGGLKMRQSIFSDRRSFGFGDVEFGAVEAVNLERNLDHLIDYGYGRAASAKIGEEDADYSSFTTVMSGVANQILPEVKTLTLGWRERIDELDDELQQGTFAGTNSGTTGLEGTENDIKGRRKPYAGGRPQNLQPVLLNSSMRILGWRWDADGNRLPSASVDAVRVYGSDLWNLTSDYADAAALDAATVIQGEYATCLAESLIKLGGSDPKNLTGAVSLDVTIEATLSDRYIGSQIEAILLAKGVPAGRINSADITAINAALPYEVQVVVQDESARQALDELMKSGLICGWVDGSDQYRFAKIEPLDAQVPVATFKRLKLGETLPADAGDLIALKGVLTGNSDKDVPLHAVKVGYARNWLVQSAGSIADAVPADEAAQLLEEFRFTDEATDAGTLAKYPKAGSLEHQTLLIDEADAEAIRDDLLALLGEYRLTLEVQVKLDAELAAALSVGKIVKLQLPLFGMESGRLAQVMEYSLESIRSTATLKLWMAGNG